VYIREEIIEVCDYANVVPHRAQLKKWSDGFPGLNGMSSTDKTTSGQASSVDHALTEIFPREIHQRCGNRVDSNSSFRVSARV
jgi:hypothetical protein